ncbi:MAG: nucleosidase [Alphaproteobacteria bacterium]
MITKTTSKPLLVFAMKEECGDVFQAGDDQDLLFTGIGKVNAAYVLTKRLYGSENGKPESEGGGLHLPRPSVVVNMGTAGSRRHKGGMIVNCTRFIQRDMDVTPLGFARGQTPFSDDPVVIEYGLALETKAAAAQGDTLITGGVCGTGDNFDVSEDAENYDAVDMEAYALALICQREKIPFLCLKYISDGADEGAHIDWNESLRRAAQALNNVYGLRKV